MTGNLEALQPAIGVCVVDMERDVVRLVVVVWVVVMVEGRMLVRQWGNAFVLLASCLAAGNLATIRAGTEGVAGRVVAFLLTAAVVAIYRFALLRTLSGLDRAYLVLAESRLTRW